MTAAQDFWKAKVAIVTLGLKKIRQSPEIVEPMLQNQDVRNYFEHWRRDQEKQHEEMMRKCRDPEFRGPYTEITINFEGFENELYSVFKHLSYDELVEISNICGSEEFLENTPDIEQAYYPGFYKQIPQQIPPELDGLRKRFFQYSWKLRARNVYQIFVQRNFCARATAIPQIGGLTRGALRCIEFDQNRHQTVAGNESPSTVLPEEHPVTEHLTGTEYDNKSRLFPLRQNDWLNPVAEVPRWLCPTCKKGHYSIKGALQELETGPSKIERMNNEEWIDLQYKGRFCGFLECDNCKEIAFIGGETRYEDYAYEDEYQQACSGPVKYISTVSPAPLPIEIPPNTPQSIKNYLQEASEMYWGNPAAALGKLRSSIEQFLTERGVPKPKGSKLNGRIEEYLKSNRHMETLLHAVRTVGNEGSHGEVTVQEKALDELHPVPKTPS